MTILIFGATGGVGANLARRLTRSGRTVHLSGRDEERLQALAEELSGPATAGDILDDGVVEDVVAAAGTPLTGLVYAVGSITLKPIGRTTDDDMLRDFSLNALGAARAIRAALPALKQADTPSIVLFSTVAASLGFASHASIAMAKGAVEGLTRTLAAELSPRIRVNCIAPSLTRTPLTASLLASEKAEDSLARAHPMNRIGEADDIAAMAAFLLSDQSGWITGQSLAVDGGRSTLA